MLDNYIRKLISSSRPSLNLAKRENFSLYLVTFNNNINQYSVNKSLLFITYFLQCVDNNECCLQL